MPSQKDGIFLGMSPPPGKPKGLLDAISEIQQFFVVERGGSEIPGDFLTYKGKLGFFEVGFKGGLISGLVSALLTPFAIGVMERYVPIFGSYNPTTFDKFFAFLLAISFALGYASFLGIVGKYYIGSLTKSAIRNLLAGLFAGAALKLVLVVIFFHFLYFHVLTPERLATAVLFFKGFFRYETLNAVYQWILGFRVVFLTSAYFMVFTTLLLIVIPLGSIFVNSRRTRKMLEQEEFWK